MPHNKLSIVFVLFFLVFTLPSPVLASHPECASGTTIKENFVTEKPDIEDCPANTCYQNTTPVGCYKIVDPSTIPPAQPANTQTTPQAPPSQGTSVTGGISCSANPTLVPRGGYFTFQASGLMPGKSYKIAVGRIAVQSRDQSGDIRSVFWADKSGSISTDIYPESVFNADEALVSISEQAGGTLGNLLCHLQIRMATTISDSSKTPRYRCNYPNPVCEEVKDYAGGYVIDNTTTPDKTACDQACQAEGSTFPTSKTNKDLTKPQCVRKGEINPNKLPICSTSAGDECAGGKGLNTALGCIETDPAAFINELLRFVVGISGGIALLLMIFGSIRMMTSSGDAESLKAGREQFSSAVIGLLFIIFSVLLLQIIGVDILKIPGLEP